MILRSRKCITENVLELGTENLGCRPVGTLVDLWLFILPFWEESPSSYLTQFMETINKGVEHICVEKADTMVKQDQPKPPPYNLNLE